jgi:anti-sigma regulatory factor (Ser/Thr protein kinase)
VSRQPAAISFLELRTSAALSSIRVLNDLLEVACRALGLKSELVHDLALGVAELVANVVKHELAEQPGEVVVRLEQVEQELVLTVVSAGPPFDLDAALDQAEARDPLQDLDGSGLGLPLLLGLFDRIEHDYEVGRGNRIALRRMWEHDGAQ